MLNDPLFKSAFEAYLSDERDDAVVNLLSAVRKSERDTMYEARQAGYIEAYETIEANLKYFAQQQLAKAQG
ncbi:MAG: hypothetical protein JO356_01140 [Acidobacteria bacterium]|nr:hypothetical protein [Acidobacteriota bacterium]